MKDQKRNRVLYLHKLLTEQSDELHPVTITEMLGYLNENGIDANRRTIAGDIAQLQEIGVDIVCNKSRQNRYFIAARPFELPELKLLVDAVQSSRFITTRKSKELIEKLAGLTSSYQAEELNRQLYVDKQVKANNESLYYTIDMIHTAINSERQIVFQYYEYNQHKQKVFKHDGQLYQFSPYALFWNNDSYYVIGHSISHDKVIKFRVDRIALPTETDIPAEPRPDDFDIAVYAKTIFQMFDDEINEVTLLCENGLMKTIIDRFGEDISTEPVDDAHFFATIKVSTSNTFFGWVFSFGGKMKILSPQPVLDRYKTLAGAACEIN